MSAASWMYDLIVAVSMIVSPLHQWSQAIMPGLTQLDVGELRGRAEIADDLALDEPARLAADHQHAPRRRMRRRRP